MMFVFTCTLPGMNNCIKSDSKSSSPSLLSGKCFFLLSHWTFSICFWHERSRWMLIKTDAAEMRNTLDIGNTCNLYSLIEFRFSKLLTWGIRMRVDSPSMVSQQTANSFVSTENSSKEFTAASFWIQDLEWRNNAIRPDLFSGRIVAVKQHQHQQKPLK